MAQEREKFATQVRSDVLKDVRSLADREGRQLQALVEEALADLLEKRRNAKPRLHVMAEYQASHAKYGDLYRKLAR
jgi:mRNA-degrading endonuclease RelE of RelBE toxin-antitoxin system